VKFPLCVFVTIRAGAALVQAVELKSGIGLPAGAKAGMLPLPDGGAKLMLTVADPVEALAVLVVYTSNLNVSTTFGLVFTTSHTASAVPFTTGISAYGTAPVFPGARPVDTMGLNKPDSLGTNCA
jgi:hypothetical protein